MKDVRVFANLIEGKGRNGEDFYGKVNDFDQLTIAASAMVEQEADKFVLLSELAEIAAEINAGLKDNELTGTEFNLAEFSTLPGLTGTAIYNPADLHFKVAASTGDETVKLELKLTPSADEKTYTLTLQGELSSQAAMLSIAEGSLIELTMAQPYQLAGGTNDESPQPVKGKLKLQASLSQIASATVTNPMSFTGNIEGALQAIVVPTYENTGRAGAYRGYEFFDEMQLLPGALSLAGALKNQQQDEVSVVLTAKIKNLETFVAAGLQYYGKKLPDGVQLTLSDDLNTLTMSSSGLTGQRVFTYTPGSTDGQYLYESKTSYYWNPDAAQQTRSLIQLAQENTDAGIVYTMLTGYESNDQIMSANWARIYPSQQNGMTKYYLRRYNLSKYSTSYQPLDAQGQVVNLDTVSGTDSQYYDSISALVAAESLVVDPSLPHKNLTEILSASYSHAFIENDIDFKELGDAVVQLFDIDFEQLEQKKTMLINGYLIFPRLSETATLTTNADLTQAKLAFFDQEIISTVTQQNGDLLKSYQIDRFEAGQLRDSALLNINRIIGTQNGLYLACEQIPLTHFDPNNARKMVFLKKTVENNTTYLSYASDWNVTLTANGKYLSAGGGERDASNLSYTKVSYSSSQLIRYCGIDPDSNSGSNAMAGTLIFPAALYDGQIGWSRFAPKVKDVGNVSMPELLTPLTANTNKELRLELFDPAPNPSNNLEAGDNFLKVDAALTVQAKIAGYSLSATLEASRTAIDDAKLGLNVVYKLPDDSAQRSFKVTGATDSNLVELSNNEGVTVSLDRSIKSGNSQVTLGEIKVGGVKMAEIINRSGVVLIKYSNNNIESL